MHKRMVEMYCEITSRAGLAQTMRIAMYGMLIFGCALTSPSAAAQSDQPSTHQWRMPIVVVVESGGSRPLSLEKTQLAQTKTKATSMASLAGDAALNQAIQAGVSDTTFAAASHINSGIGNSAIQQTGSIFNGVMAKRKPSVTYVWAVPNAASPNVMQTAMPQFATDFSLAPGANPDDFQPAIVKLTPAQNIRLVGASEGKQDAASSPTADWEIYSHFVEDPIVVKLQKLAPGKYAVTPGSPLLPGEYALVLRPVSKDKKFSGGDVVRAQGDGLMFDAVWTFQIPDSAR